MTCLRSTRPLRPFVEGLEVTRAWRPPPVPSILRPYLSTWSAHPPSHRLPSRAWVQLNRLHTGVGRFAASMCAWSLAISDTCCCGRPQTPQHVLKCIAVPPWPLTDLDNPVFMHISLHVNFDLYHKHLSYEIINNNETLRWAYACSQCGVIEISYFKSVPTEAVSVDIIRNVTSA